jgi:hypothetical protein
VTITHEHDDEFIHIAEARATLRDTVLSPECGLEPSSIFFLLKDIEQMTWRQLCLLEGFRRQVNDEIKISSDSTQDIDGFSIETEIKQLIDLNYLHKGSDSPLRSYLTTSFDHIHISALGQATAKLLDLKSVELREIGKAFGGGRVTNIKIERY